MCGIVGLINHKATKGSKAYVSVALCKTFEDMLWADQLRGKDGTGVMQMTSDLDVNWVKVAGEFINMDNDPKWPSFYNAIDSSFFTIGHNRAATSGKKIAENAHPFTFGHVTLVHNGTLRSFPRKYEHKEKDLDVDSRALTEMIADLGIKKAVEEFSGAYACVWLDSKDNSLNIARNSERPMWFVGFDGGVLLASESYLPAWCGSRNGLTNIEFKPTEINTHYKIYAEDNKHIIEEKYTPRIIVPVSHYGMYSNLDDNDDTTATYWKNQNKEYLQGQKGSTNKKEKFRSISSTEDGVYSVGDPVCFTIDSWKATQSQFTVLTGQIEEPAADELRHRITGNTILPVSTLADSTKLFTGTISAILKSKTDFYLIHLREINELKHEEEKKEPPKSNVLALPHKRTKTSYEGVVKCDACDTFVVESEIEKLEKETKYADKDQTIQQIIHVCQRCANAIENDLNLFDKTYTKVLAKEGAAV